MLDTFTNKDFSCNYLDESLICFSLKLLFLFCVVEFLSVHFFSSHTLFLGLLKPQSSMANFHPKLLEKKKCLPLSSFLLEIEDTFLANEDISKLVAKFSNSKPRSISEKVFESGFFQATRFIEAIHHPKIVLECHDRYHATKKFIEPIIENYFITILLKRKDIVYTTIFHMTSVHAKGQSHLKH